MSLLSWFLDLFKAEEGTDPVEKERKPKPADWKSRVISKLTVTPRKGQVTLWGQTNHAPETIEVMPSTNGPRKPEHIVPVGFQKPPSIWRDPRFIAAGVLAILALGVTFAIRHP